MSLALMGAAAARGVSQAIVDQPMREERIKQAQQQTRMNDQQESIQALQLEAMQTQQATQGLHRAFDGYFASGDAKYLNHFLRDTKRHNPVGAKLHGHINQFEPVTDTPEARRALAASGIATEAMDAFFAQGGQRNYAWAYTNTGEKKMVDVRQVAIGTGYQDWADQKRLDEMESQAKLARALRSGADSQLVKLARYLAGGKEPTKAHLTEAAELLSQGGKLSDFQYTMGVLEQDPAWSERSDAERLEEAKRISQRQFAGTEAERLAAQWQLEGKFPGFSQAEYLEMAIRYKGDKIVRESVATTRPEGGEQGGSSRIDEIEKDIRARNDKKNRTSGQKTVDAATKARGELDKLVDGNFLETDFKGMTPTQRDQMRVAVFDYATIAGRELSADQRKEFVDISRMMMLGDKAAAEVTPEQTGFIDRLFFQANKYLFEDTAGIEGESSYFTLMNEIRHALYGAALTKTEQSSFYNMAGSLWQQHPQAMASLKAQLENLNNQFNLAASFVDPYIVKGLLSTHGEELQDTMGRVTNLVQALEKAKSSTTKEAEAVEKGLDEIFNPADLKNEFMGTGQ